MLSDTKLRTLKPQEKPYKVADRDGLYVVVTPAGTISFRYNYRLMVARRRWSSAATGLMASAWPRLVNFC